MQLSPLNIPNISSSRFKTESFSFELDYRGYPHISWQEDRNGQTGVLYRFWDGLQWGFYGDTPLVDKSYAEIIYSNKSLAFDELNKPIIVYARKEEQNKICVATILDSKWQINEINVDKEIKWIGVQAFTLPEEYSSSSSSSLGNSSSSSSVITSSNSSEFITSSSSSLDSSSHSTSSSSSIISSSSFSTEWLSSSSYMDFNFRIIVIDTDNNLHIYSYDETLSLLSSIALGDFDEIKISKCGSGKYIGFSTGYNNNIYYNFFDVFENDWSFATFRKISGIGPYLSYDIDGHNTEDTGELYISWNESEKLKFGIVTSNDPEGSIYLEMDVETFETGVTSSKFTYNTKGKVSVAAYQNKQVLLTTYGAQNLVYNINFESYAINKNVVQINGQPLKYNPIYPKTKIFSNIVFNCCFVSNYSVYHYSGELLNGELVYKVPKLSILNTNRYKYGIYHEDENVIDFYEYPCTWDNRTGDILLESFKRVVVAADEQEDPLCYSSSSSSSNSSSSSSSTSSSSSNSSSSSSSTSSSSTSISSESSMGTSSSNSSSSSSLPSSPSMGISSESSEPSVVPEPPSSMGISSESSEPSLDQVLEKFSESGISSESSEPSEPSVVPEPPLEQVLENYEYIYLVYIQ